MVDSLSKRNRVTNKRDEAARIHKPEYRREGTQRKRIPPIFPGSSLTIQLNTDKHRHGRKLSETGKRYIQEEFGRTVTKIHIGQRIVPFPIRQVRKMYTCKISWKVNLFSLLFLKAGLAILETSLHKFPNISYRILLKCSWSFHWHLIGFVN